MSCDTAARATDEVATDTAPKPETMDSPPPPKPGTGSTIPLTGELLEAYGYRLPYAYHYADYIWPGLLFSAERLEVLKGFRFRPSDVLIVSYPKSGTTWVSELVSLIVNRGDISAVLKSTLHERVPWLELDQKNFWVWFFTVWQGIVKLIGLPNMSIGTNIDVDQGNRVVGSSVEEPVCAQGDDDAATGGPPRVFFTHLPLELLPKHVLDGGCRIIYVARNPKDTAVSFFHFHQMARFLGQQTTTWEEFFPLFANGKVYSGSWFDHVTSYWEFCKFNKKMLFVKYEDLKRDLAEQVGVLCDFLGTPLEPAAVSDVVAHCAFKKMQDNKLVNREGIWLFNHKISRFMRKGIVGDWKNYFTVAQNGVFDALCRGKLAESGLEFDYDQECEDESDADVSVLESESSSSSSDSDSASGDDSEGEKCGEGDEESEVEREKVGSEEDEKESKGDKSRSESEASDGGDSGEEKELDVSKEGDNEGVDGKTVEGEAGNDEDDAGEESGDEEGSEKGSGDEIEGVDGVNAGENAVNGGDKLEEMGSVGDLDRSDILANVNMSRGEPDNAEDDKQRNFDSMEGGDGMVEGVRVMELQNDQTN